MDFKPFAHQETFANMWGQKSRVLNFDGCGTGKTLACIHAVKTYWPGARVLVLAPLSILRPAWEKDLKFGWPMTTVDVADKSSLRKTKAFEGNCQWILTNHDSVKLIAKNGWQSKFDVLIVDEGDAFRNASSQRSKAIQAVAAEIPVMTLMTGTPTPNSVTDVWHLAYLTDRGKRLGKNFYGFRGQVCYSEPVYGAPPGAQNWIDREGANDHVTERLKDITSRVALDDVTELPETIYRDIGIIIPKKLRDKYEHLKNESILELDNGELINAVHAGSRTQKLLQTLSGAVYDEEGVAQDLHPERHALVLDLVEETDHCLVAFNWTHQRNGLVAMAKSRKLSYAVIDGSVPAGARAKIVERFQNGELRVIFAHPQSAGHGLTLTKANRIIWSSPTYRADLYEQFNHRIIRTGQRRKTEVIHLSGVDTAEEIVYQKLGTKTARMRDLLETLTELNKAA
jgi:SNF2 family DNA or RNA helicase